MDFICKKKLRINIKHGKSVKNLCVFFALPDETCCLQCPQKFLAAEEHHFGVNNVNSGLKRKEYLDVSENNGFVVTSNQKTPKISFHPDGVIHASLSHEDDFYKTRQVKIHDFPDCKGHIARLQWHNIQHFSETAISDETHSFNIESPRKNLNYLDAALWVSKDLYTLIPDDMDDETIASVTKNIISNLPERNFLIANKIFRYSGEANYANGTSIKREFPFFIFGTKNLEGNIIWYRLIILHHRYFELNSEDAHFFVRAGIQNLGLNSKYRQSGEEVVLISTLKRGLKKLKIDTFRGTAEEAFDELPH